MAKDQMTQIRSELKKIASQTAKLVNDFWIDSLTEMKGLPITKELVDGLAKISQKTLMDEINKRL